MDAQPQYIVLVRIDTRPDPSNETIVTSRWFSDGAWNDPDALVFPSPRIAAPITFKRQINTVFWGGGRVRPSFGSLQLLTGDDRALDWVFVEPLRDAAVSIFMVEAGKPLSAARQVAAARVDGVSADSETLVTLSLADTSAVLERPIQSELYQVEGLEGQPRPVSIGVCYSVPVVQAGLPDLLYDVHDDWTAEASLVRDMGVELSGGTDWSRPKNPPHHFELFASPVGRLVADVAGAVSVIDVFLDNDFSDADQWGNVPSIPFGWSIETTGSGSVSRTDDGAWLRNGTFPPDPSIAAMVSSELPAAGLWYIRVDVAASLFFGEVEIGLHQSGPGYQVIATVTEPGSYLFQRDVDDLLGADQIVIRTRGRSGLNFPSAVISHARIYRRVEGAGPRSSTGELEPLMRYVLVDRAGWPESQVDWSSVSAIHAFGWTFGFHAPRPVATTTILDELVRSWGGWWNTDRLGRIRVGRIPLLETFPQPALRLGPAQIVGGVSVTIDSAPGLSDTWSGGRNWQPYAESELAGSLQGTSLGALLVQRYRFRRRAPLGAFFPGYRDAVARPTVSATSSRSVDRDEDPGVPTLFQVDGDVQQAADYAGALYSVPRHFVSLAAALDPLAAAQIEPGEIVSVVSERWGLDDNSRMLLVEIEGAIGAGQIKVRLWGDITMQPPPVLPAIP